MSASSKFFQGITNRTSSASASYGSRVWNQIKHWMEHHPIAANSALTLTLWICGDALAQYSEHRLTFVESSSSFDSNKAENEKNVREVNGRDDRAVDKSQASTISTEATTTSWNYDYRRTAECASYGAFFSGPLIAVWYPYLDKLCNRFSLAQRYGPWGAPVAKVFADEFLMDPPCLVVFFGYMNVCEGGTLQTFQHKLQEEFMRAWLTSLAIWPVVLLGTFRYLPVFAQAPFINACCIVWDGFLSHRNAVAKLKEETSQQDAGAQEAPES